MREILQRTPGVRISDPADALFSVGRAKDRGFDVEAIHDGRPLLVEIKHQTPQTSVRLNEMTQQLRAAAQRYMSAVGSSARPELLAVFPGVLSRSKRESSRHDEVDIWDGRDLQRQARQLGIRVPTFVAAFEGEESAADREPAQELTQRLAGMNPGRSDAPAYEKWCEDLLNFLFCPPLNSPIAQHRDDVGANRRDLIMPNYATRGFWRFMRNHYGAAFVVAEAKNVTSPVDKLAVLQLANYLSRHGTGLFGILLTRHEMNASARWTRREQWVLHDKMIIALDDEDMQQMLLTKLAGNSPAALIQQRIEDFRLRI